MARMFRYGASPGAGEALDRMNMGIDIRDTLPTVNVPVLVLHFTDDPWAPVEGGRALAEPDSGRNVCGVGGKLPHPIAGGGRSHR